MSPIDVNSSESASHDNSELESYLLLRDDQLRQIEQFREDARRCGSDSERFALCEQLRDELLDQHASLELLIAAADGVMCAECPEYKTQKENIRLKRSHTEKAAEWERFFGFAVEGSKCLAPLKTVCRIWGREKVQHYRWAYKGESYCKKLCAAARQVSDWDGEAVMKLNTLIRRRVQQPRRRCVKESVNPIEADDLINLKAWSHKDPFVKTNDSDGIALPFGKLAITDLPEDFGFDKFGLMVRKKYAVALPESGAEAADPPSVDEVSETDLVIQSMNNTVHEILAAESVGVGDDDSGPAVAQGTTPATTQPLSVRTTTHEHNSSDGTPNELGRTLRQRTQKPSYQETPARGSSKPKHATRPAEDAKVVQKRCCPPEVPSSLLSALNNPSVFSVNPSELNSHYQERLCIPHLREFARLLSAVKVLRESTASTTGEQRVGDLRPDNSISVFGATSGRRRTRSLPDIHHPEVLKRPRLDTTPPAKSGAERPMQDREGDKEYRWQMLTELKQKRTAPDSHGEATDKLVLRILQTSKLPNTDGAAGKMEALFLPGDEAGAKVESGTVDMPIITDQQQHFRWSGRDRPIVELFRRMVDFTRTVSVQIPSRKVTQRSFEPRTLNEIQKRFINRSESDDPWNVLDLASPLPRAILPHFLTGPNCALLSRIRDTALMQHSAERTMAATEEWAQWKDVEECVLLAEGGHNTAPHTDSHGYATWITVQEGLYGFGWMSHPTDQERCEWMTDPSNYIGGQWRYVVLKPGQTVYFNSGTIHFVFRLRGEQTLALSGHILQWTGIEQWIQVVINQRKYPDSTNEEMRWSVEKLVRSIADLVRKSVKDGRVEELGGKAIVGRFFNLVKVS